MKPLEKLESYINIEHGYSGNYLASLEEIDAHIEGNTRQAAIEALKEYVKKEEIPWLISFSGEAWLDANAKMYNVNSIPSVWLVDKKGVLRYFDIHGEDIEKAVLKLLAE